MLLLKRIYRRGRAVLEFFRESPALYGLRFIVFGRWLLLGPSYIIIWYIRRMTCLVYLFRASKCGCEIPKMKGGVRIAAPVLSRPTTGTGRFCVCCIFQVLHSETAQASSPQILVDPFLRLSGRWDFGWVTWQLQVGERGLGWVAPVGRGSSRDLADPVTAEAGLRP